MIRFRYTGPYSFWFKLAAAGYTCTIVGDDARLYESNAPLTFLQEHGGTWIVFLNS